jgi:chromosome segregation protein
MASAIAAVSERRRRAADARAALASLTREVELAARRRTSLEIEIRSWRERAERATAVAQDLEARLAEAAAERAALADAPDSFVIRRRAIEADIVSARIRHDAAAAQVVSAEASSRERDAVAQAALSALSAARERKAASEVRAEAAMTRLAEVTRIIAETTDTNPDGLMQLAGLGADAPLPVTGTTESRLAELKGDRERLGGVNLRAEDELSETEGKRDALAGERDDLTEAIKRLRTAISSLNREGRERLAAAFDVVNAHFQRLFTTLFGGGSAELLLVDSDDPLEAGLEITAMPPGKKPQSLVLLSGGEQALTATALIFAVFLTNPSPICVLDEVDAPLDDSNVERYCDLLRAMAGETDTRFVVITHNPITMARMDRLFGVTMAERGVSQLVSVDLQAAERILDVS